MLKSKTKHPYLNHKSIQKWHPENQYQTTLNKSLLNNKNQILNYLILITKILLFANNHTHRK